MTLSFSTNNFFKFGRAEEATKEIICRTELHWQVTRKGDDGVRTCPMTSGDPSRADSNGWIIASCFSGRESTIKC